MIDDHRLAAKAARVHRLSDPLAAIGQRAHGERLRRERNARLALLGLTLGATLGISGLIAAMTDPPADTDVRTAQQTVHIRSGSS